MSDAQDFELEFDRAVRLLQRARRVVVLTGAGISTESGIPDFRGPNGVWAKDPSAEKMATLEVYMTDPAVRRRAWQRRLEFQALAAQPNAGHHALCRLESGGTLDTLITQNIDGLHQRAGSSREKIVEIHGTVHEVVCMVCGERGPMSAALERVRAGEADPPCRSCGGILKSATISFGQSLVVRDLQRVQQAALRCDLMLAVGTTLSVFPVAAVVPTAQQSGAALIIINGGATEMDDRADALLRGPIGELLPRLVDRALSPAGY